MSYPLLKKAPKDHASQEFLDFLRENNKVVYENNEWLVIENCKYHTPKKPWLTAFHKGQYDSNAITELWSLWCGGDFESWKWIKKAASKQTIKRFHIHLVKE
jgi:hypothetical protein